MLPGERYHVIGRTVSCYHDNMLSHCFPENFTHSKNLVYSMVRQLQFIQAKSV
jgi:hypothetical protein